MIVSGVDVLRMKDIWFNKGPQIESLSTLIIQESKVINPVRTKPDSISQSLPFEVSLLINPPLLNSQINRANPRKIPNPLRPAGRVPVNNPYFFFGSSVLTVGFGISLIPGLTDAAQALGIIEDPDSFEYEMNNTF